MSSLLREAIVDATALKEAALKNAEATIIEKYSNEVKDTIDKLLEQDELDLELGGPLEEPSMEAPAGGDELGGELGGDLGGGLGAEPVAEEVEEVIDEDIPLAASDGLSKEVGVNLEEAPNEGEEIEFNVNLGALQEAIAELRSELEEDEEIEINEEDLASLLEGEVALTIDDPAEEEDADSKAMTAAGLEEDQEDLKELKPAVHSSTATPEAQEEWEDSPMGRALNRFAKGKTKKEEEPEEEPKEKTGWEGVTVDDITMGGKYGTNEELEISEDLIDAVMERLTVDMGATLKGWAGRSSEDIKWELTKALSHRRSTDFEEEMKDLKKAQEELVFENSQIKEHNKKYKQTLEHLKENLQDINLSNARLLYTNRVLRNTSLNERQKEKIAEAISNAGSVIEAKTIYNTLQSTMEAKQSKRSPQSLSEAIGSRPSFLRATRKESKPVNTLSDRMKKLAGIK